MKQLRRQFDLNLLKSLDALLAEKNVTRAARLVHVSQPTMSGIFRRLRDEFNDPLLVRQGRRYELSPLANMLSTSVRHILLQIEAMWTSSPLFDPQTDSRSFRIMASDYGTMVCLPKFFPRMEKLAPNLRFEIVPVASPLEHLLDGSVDMCIVDDDAYEKDSHPLLRSDVLFTDSFCFVVDRNHPLSGSVTLEDIRKYPKVLTTCSGVETPTQLLRVIEKRRAGKPNIMVPGYAVISSIVQGTTAIGLLPRRMLPATKGVRSLDVSFEPPVFAQQAIWHARFDYDPAFCWFRNAVLDAFDYLPAASTA